jgi:hypothetical protein
MIDSLSDTDSVSVLGKNCSVGIWLGLSMMLTLLSQDVAASLTPLSQNSAVH